MNNGKLIVKSQSLLPDHFSAYFWDTQFTGREFLDWPEHTIERVLEYGQWKDIRFLRGIVGDEAIRSVVKSSRRLSPKTVNLWTILLNISRREVFCFQKPSHLIPTD
jgi:hypothetical protein